MKIILLFLIVFSTGAESFKLKNFLKEFWTATRDGFRESFSRHRSQPPTWSTEQISSAQYVTRDKQGSIMKNSPIDHHGIKFTTTQGNNYLLHNTPGTGPVVTDASHMSSNWHTIHDIDVSGGKTVGGALGSAGFDLLGRERCSYIRGGTCIGTAQRVEKYLKNNKKN